jgi:hypothetical protein
MTDDAARERVAERLAALREADERLVQALESTTAGASRIPGTAIDREPVEALDGAIAGLRQPLPTGLRPLTAAAGNRKRKGLDPSRKGKTPSVDEASAAAQSAYMIVGEAFGAAAALVTTGRLMFEGVACDLAVDRMKTYTQVTKALNALIPQVVGWELREQGLACRCVCPMCGLGVCGCIWASLHLIDSASGGPGLTAPDDRGIPLRSPPRAGSQVAAAGVRQWDRVVAVDDEPVRSAPELQAALRRHSIGEDVRLRVERDAQSRELVVRHTSDLP